MEADKLKEDMGDAGKDSIKKELLLSKAADLVVDNAKERAKSKSKKDKEEGADDEE
jgi:trigger factor